MNPLRPGSVPRRVAGRGAVQYTAAIHEEEGGWSARHILSVIDRTRVHACVSGTPSVIEEVGDMKNRLLVAPVLLTAFLIAGSALAAEKPSVEKGKALFNDPKLGTTGSSCNTCHAGGEGLEDTANETEWTTGGKTHKTLEDALNACITAGLQGKALDVKSVEMQSLVLYIKSLGQKKAGAPKKPDVGY